jgi:hypothetical protein
MKFTRRANRYLVRSARLQRGEWPDPEVSQRTRSAASTRFRAGAQQCDEVERVDILVVLVQRRGKFESLCFFDCATLAIRRGDALPLTLTDRWRLMATVPHQGGLD